MIWVEWLLVGGAVVLASWFVIRQFVRPFKKTKGSCRACGEVCGCELAKRNEDKT
jgi:hypothetical protein